MYIIIYYIYIYIYIYILYCKNEFVISTMQIYILVAF